MKCFKCESVSTIQDDKVWTCWEHIRSCGCGKSHSSTDGGTGGALVGFIGSTANPSKERIKLEAMFYHMRDKKHVRFLESNELYAQSRTVNTFKGGKLILDADYMQRGGSSFNRGRTIVVANTDEK